MSENDETVERVARAILSGHDWTVDGGQDPMSPVGWESVRPDWQDAYRSMARAAIAAMPEPWQKIESAPKDGDFLARLGNGYITRARFVAGKYFASDSAGSGSKNSDTNPTHWRPLPAPPEA